MAVHLFCGKICSGKSWLARELAKKMNTVILNCDEIMTLFPPIAGDEAYARVSDAVKNYLYRKAAEIARCGPDVILDWGFWKRAERRAAEAFFAGQGIAVQWYYLDISDETWERNIARRNANKAPADYYVDEGLKNKCLAAFEKPDQEESAGWMILRK